MDTTSIVTHHTVITQISNNLEPIGWVLLFLGWLLYWFKQLDTVRSANKGKGAKVWAPLFFADNIFEIPTSLLACFVLVILGKDIPTDLIDLKGKLSILLIGYSSSSILNGLITKFKPAPKQ
jgi:hypothetical protein